MMLFLRYWLTSVVFLFGLTGMGMAIEPPEKVEACLRNGAAELLTASGRDDLWRVYLKYTDRDQLGAYLYGARYWPSFSNRQKDYGYKLFFDSLASVSNQSQNATIDSSTVTITKMRLTDYTPTLTKNLAGQVVTIYRVVTTIQDGQGKQLKATIYITSNCHVFDLQQDALLSITVDVAMVERSMK